MQPVFRSTDSGAPTLGNVNGSLVGVLDSVLVNGYGALAPLGWTIAYTATNKRVYQQGAGSGFCLRVDDSENVYNAAVRGAESFSDIDTYSGGFPTAAQLAAGTYIQKTNNSAGDRAWVAWGDAKRFILFINTHSSSVQYNAIYFGDFVSFRPGDAYNCILIAKATSRVDGEQNSFSLLGNSGPYGSVLAGHYVARAYTGIGSAIAVQKYTDTRQLFANLGTGTPGTDCLTYPDPISGGLHVSRLFIGEGGAPRGYLPGLWNVCHNKGSMTGVANGDTFDGSDGIASRSFELRFIYSNTGDGCCAIETSDWLESA